MGAAARLLRVGPRILFDRGDHDADVGEPRPWESRLVEFEPGVRVGLSFFTMQDELSELLARRVDLNTPGFLGRHIRERILVEAHELYVAA